MFFLLNQSMDIIYPNEENVFLLPNVQKKRRLLCESVFVQIDKRTLIQKMVEREVFLMKPMHQFIYPNEKNDFVVPNH